MAVANAAWRYDESVFYTMFCSQKPNPVQTVRPFEQCQTTDSTKRRLVVVLFLGGDEPTNQLLGTMHPQ